MSIKNSKNNKFIKIISSYITSPNIALIKYWGKLDEELILPLNTSLGVTLNTEDLQTKTKASFSDKYDADQLILNNKPHDISKRLQNILKTFREQYLHNIANQIYQGKKISEQVDLSKFHIKVKSVNDFPTAAGLASSSSGLAALALCLCDIFYAPANKSEIARLGSGSACRSIYGGLVIWQGVDENCLHKWFQNGQQLTLKELDEQSKICISKQIYPSAVFDYFSILILAYSFGEKDVSSTSGMAQTVQTSQLLRARVTESVKDNIQSLIKSIETKNFNDLADIIMRDSNQFHAVCLDTMPPIFYLNEFSKLIISIIVKLNDILKIKTAYTFDAGPHAVLFVPNQILDLIFYTFVSIFDLNKADQFNKRAYQYLQQLQKQNLQSFNAVQSIIDKIKLTIQSYNKPQYVILTNVGDGPKKIN